LAEGILSSKLKSTAYFVDSAGTSGHHNGELPDQRSIAIAKKYNIDLTTQRSRKFILDDFDIFDYIYVMDAANYENIMALAQTEAHKQKVKRIMNMAYPNENIDVPDPYYGGALGFQKVYDMLDHACDNIVTKIHR
jgi:protein-tyrosine phosphatase